MTESRIYIRVILEPKPGTASLRLWEEHVDKVMEEMSEARNYFASMGAKPVMTVDAFSDSTRYMGMSLPKHHSPPSGWKKMSKSKSQMCPEDSIFYEPSNSAKGKEFKDLLASFRTSSSHPIFAAEGLKEKTLIYYGSYIPFTLCEWVRKPETRVFLKFGIGRDERLSDSILSRYKLVTEYERNLVIQTSKEAEHAK